MKSFLFLSLFLLCNSCLPIYKSPFYIDNQEKNRICFWKATSELRKFFTNEKKIFYDFTINCEAIIFFDEREGIGSMRYIIENELNRKDNHFTCEEQVVTIKNPIIVCLKNEILEDTNPVEIKSKSESLLINSYTLNIRKKIFLAGFDIASLSEEIVTQMEKNLDYIYKNFSDRRIFFAGFLDLQKIYNNPVLLEKANYLLISKRLECENNSDKENYFSIFTDSASQTDCKCKKWELNKLNLTKEYSTNNDPFVIECRWKNN
jgi:hypothetical protein